MLRRRLPSPVLVAVLLGISCKGSEPRDKKTDPPAEEEDSASPGPDLTVTLGPGEARAGVMTELDADAAAWGGLSAEGRAGDVKIYNDRARFIIQGLREGGFVVRQGGVVVDADIVRPDGQPGRDIVDEWASTAGLNLLMDPTEIEIVDDGSESGVAIVRMAGPEGPLEYLSGAVESDAAIVRRDLWFETLYTLEADSPLLRVETTITATGAEQLLSPGDVLMGSKEVGLQWIPGQGLTQDTPETYGWVGFESRRGDLALATMAAPDDSFVRYPAADLINGLLAVTVAFTEPVEIPPGGSVSIVRYYGVGSDLATLTDAWLQLRGEPTEVASGVVSAPDGPVEGARVNVLVDGLPFTVVRSGPEGDFSALVPAGSAVSFRADGTGTRTHTDLPAGATPFGPYATEGAREEALEALRSGALPVPQAQGRGLAPAEDGLALLEPGWLVLDAGDGLPFEARISGGAGLDPALVPSRPHGHAALAWARDGEVEIPLEPGDYTLTAWRGLRCEAAQRVVTVAAGERLVVELDLPCMVETPTWFIADPHHHAAPSPDGGITMEDRLVVASGVGIELHFGTDHDHVVDYSPLLDPLGLAGRVRTVVATEISPVLRGHVNAYPLRSNLEAENGGAFAWWRERPESTDALFSDYRAWYADAILQINHPLSGVASFSGWSPGRIENPAFWTSSFDAIEVMNSGSYGEELELYLDLVSRGLKPAPVGVSDSHHYLQSGLSVTWLGTGTEGVGEISDEVLLESMRARRTVVSRGPFIRTSIAPGSEVVGGATLEVQATGPSWVQVDRLRLLRDGEEVERVEGSSASFVLSPEKDAVYVVIAEGDRPMEPVSSWTPWAMISPIFVDPDGDGWEPPLPPLELGD